MPSVDELLAQIAQLQQTINLQARTIAQLTNLLADDGEGDSAPAGGYLGSRN